MESEAEELEQDEQGNWYILDEEGTVIYTDEDGNPLAPVLPPEDNTGTGQPVDLPQLPSDSGQSGAYDPSYMWNQNGWLCRKMGLTITSPTFPTAGRPRQAPRTNRSFLRRRRSPRRCPTGFDTILQKNI